MAARKFKSTGITIPVIGYSDIDVQNIKDLPDEIWKEFYVGDLCYFASSLGRIKRGNNIIAWNNGHKICYKNLYPKILRGTLTTDGYIRISISKRKTFFVHRLIAECFIGNSNLEVNHKNGNKLDNRIDNLEFCTKLENIHHAIKMGLFDMRKINYDRKKRSVITPKRFSKEDVLKIKHLYRIEKIKQKEIAKMYNVHKDTIGRVIREERAYKEV